MVAAAKPKEAPPAPVLEEGVLLLRFGRTVYEDLLRSSTAFRVNGLELPRFGDYMHHFGFSLERELTSPDVPSLPVNAGTDDRGSLLAATPMEQSGPREDAGDGVPREQLLWAAQVSATLGDYNGETNAERLTQNLLQSIQPTVCRHGHLSAALAKVLVLYYWLCEHIRVNLEPPPAVTERSSPGSLPSAQTRPDKRRALGRKATGASPQSLEAPPPPDAVTVALSARITSPKGVATLFHALLQCAEVQCEIVPGWVKGLFADEPVPWHWNVAQIEGKRYLMDVASSVYAGPLRPPVVAEPDATLTGSTVQWGGKSTVAPPKGEAKDAVYYPEGVGKGTATEWASSPSCVDRVSITKGPPLVQGTRVCADFNVCASPQQFIFSHFPEAERHTLLVAPPSRAEWEAAPRLAPDFFRFPLQLLSHRRSWRIDTRSTPFNVAMRNASPATTELCCVLYPGTLRELREDLSDATPIDPAWVWHQREERTMVETFTMSVPRGGFYCVIIGARSIRANPYTAVIATTPFTPVVLYQVKVNFVPLNAPLVPRQHLSPCICRLMSPVAPQLMAGLHNFIVMPSCSNVLAVALVIFTPTRAGSVMVGRRRLARFLTFHADRVAYEGDFTLPAGEMVELWALYGAPDKNGVSAIERLAAEEPKRALPPLPSGTTKVTTRPSKGKRKPVANEPTPELVEREALYAYLTQGRAFQPFITHLEVKQTVPKMPEEARLPTPEVETERIPTLRRLIGITPQLYREAEGVPQRQPREMGMYFLALPKV